jgi:hypothetical protein
VSDLIREDDAEQATTEQSRSPKSSRTKTPKKPSDDTKSAATTTIHKRRKLLTRVADIERIINYTFTNKLTCAEALQLPGSSYLKMDDERWKVRPKRKLTKAGSAAMETVLRKTWEQRKGTICHPSTRTTLLTSRSQPTALARLPRRNLERRTLE